MKSTTTPIKHRHAWILAGVLVALVAMLIPAKAIAAERWETLEAIHWIENPRNTNRPGPHGELGAYQFRQRTWRMYTTTPFSQATNRDESDAVAIRHYEWLKAGLIRSGVDPSPYNIALAWNGGLSAAVRGESCSASHDYAARVSNIATQLKVKTAQVAITP